MMKTQLMLSATVLACFAMIGVARAGLVITPAAGFDITWDGNDGDFFDASAPPGGAVVPDNAALASNGGVPIASSISPHFPPHEIPNINDGFYGNTDSHITGPNPSPSWMGVTLPNTFNITSVAFGRDNGNGAFEGGAPGTDCCGGQLRDRSLGTYTLQFTTDGGSSWTDIGTLTYDNVGNDADPGGLFSPWFRHEYEVSAGGGPVVGDGIRLLLPNSGIAIDEIEIYGNLIPEPSSLALLALGLFGLLLRRRR